MCNPKANAVHSPEYVIEPAVFEKFAGRWKFSSGSDSGYEVWYRLNDTFIKGFALSLNGMDTTETLSILKQNGQWFYCPRFPANKEHEIDFRLEQQNDSSLLFVNLENDFPDSIYYQFRHPLQMQVVLSGGAGKVYKIDFKRIRP